MATVHIICGNCGNGDKRMMKYEIIKDEEGDHFSITCGNCGTIHFLYPEENK